ncbi:hypothetical protein AVEN_84866-1 [Araneus ventricosus]|uniref:Uncharacterized protein n=1 Tax=Araneus ventricosus TaxID=182803 RepID=A0A4Y2T2A1_ARAVE|nr:hypothetical protein AVEN_84866-1 [Araneus ventricosus]
MFWSPWIYPDILKRHDIPFLILLFVLNCFIHPAAPSDVCDIHHPHMRHTTTEERSIDVVKSSSHRWRGNLELKVKLISFDDLQKVRVAEEFDFGMKRQNSFDMSNPAGSRRIDGNPAGSDRIEIEAGLQYLVSTVGYVPGRCRAYGKQYRS